MMFFFAGDCSVVEQILFKTESIRLSSFVKQWQVFVYFEVGLRVCFDYGCLLDLLDF